MSVLVLPESENEGEQFMDELEDDALTEPVVESRPSDDRANVPVSVVTERFLRAILDKVPLDRVEELHLFSPLRQGTVETGIAVVAARVIVVDEVVVPAPLELQLGGDSSVDIETVEVVDAEVAPVEEAIELDNEVENEVENRADELTIAEEAEQHDDSPYADEPVQLKLEQSTEVADVGDDDQSIVEMPAEAIVETAPVVRIRHTVYTARYRLIVKGPERGKWEMEVVDEADAPLLAVETVVRGVQRRAGEETATVRYDASQLARVLRLPIPE